MRATLIPTFRILVSLALLYLALRGINVTAIQARLSQINLGWIGLCILITVFQIFLGALRWREILALCEAPLSDLHVQTDALDWQNPTTDTSEITHPSLNTPSH